MAQTTVVLTGLDALLQRLQRVGGNLPAVVGPALYREGEAIMTAAKRRTPFKTGALRASGTVLPPEQQGSSVVVTLGFGGPAVNYAVFVHENLSAIHPSGEAKFLERPVDEARAGLEQRLGAALSREIARLVGGRA